MCSANFHACPGTSAPCYSNTDAAHCGPSCLDCTLNQFNASTACGGTQCANTCAGLNLGCSLTNGLVACGTWGFESNTTEGWFNDSPTAANGGASDGTFTTSSAHPFGSNYSLAIGFNGDGTNKLSVRARVHLCPNMQALNLSGRTLTAEIYLSRTTGTGLSVGREDAYFSFYNGSTMTFAGDDYDILDNGQFITATASLQNGITDIELVFGIFQPWSGTIYVDNIQIN
jgi:hypothetical protein